MYTAFQLLSVLYLGGDVYICIIARMEVADVDIDLAAVVLDSIVTVYNGIGAFVHLNIAYNSRV